MENRYTLIAIPNDIEDSTNLRRVLNSIVIELDKLKGNRGNNAAVDQSQIIKANTAITDLVDQINNSNAIYLKRDGTNPATAPLAYTSNFSLSGLELTSVTYVDNNYLDIEGVNQINNPISYSGTFALSGLNLASVNYVDTQISNLPTLVPQTPPTLLAGDLTVSNISAKVDELILALQNSNILV